MTRYKLLILSTIISPLSDPSKISHTSLSFDHLNMLQLLPQNHLPILIRTLKQSGQSSPHFMCSIFTQDMRNDMVFNCINNYSPGLNVLLIEGNQSNWIGGSTGTTIGWAVVSFTTSSHNSFSSNTSNILAFHGTKFPAPSSLSSILSPVEDIFLKE